jgi:hypothetical protein
MVNSFVMNADLEIGGIKTVFNEAAFSAESRDAVITAYDTAARNATDTLGSIERNMENQVLSQAPGYDLTPAKQALNTILLAARVEVELNMANQIAKFDVRSIK